MRVFRGFGELVRFRHGVATIGSFDGVHLGHKVLLSRVCSLAAERGGESVVFTFEPHPRITLGCAEGLRLLDTADEKLDGLERAGVDNVVIIPFTKEFSRLSPSEFISDIIVGKAGIECIVVGYNHRFGRDKQGDFDFLSTTGLDVVRVGQYLAGERKVSSTQVRNSVAGGDMELAASLLGEPYIFTGRVQEQGEVVSPEKEYKLLPPEGLYEVLAGEVPSRMTIDRDGRAFVEGLTAQDFVYIKIIRKIC